MSIFDHFSAEDREILQARAQRAAREAQIAHRQDFLTALVVSVGQETYALPVEAVANVYEDIAVTPVPCVPPVVAGVANIRGHITLALDLAALLGVANDSKPEAITLVVLADRDLGVAFQVDSMRGVESLVASDLASVPANMALKHPAYVRGILPDGTVLLNISSMLENPDLIAASGQP